MYQTPLFELLFIYANKYIKAKQTAGKRLADGVYPQIHISDNRNYRLGDNGKAIIAIFLYNRHDKRRHHCFKNRLR